MGLFNARGNSRERLSGRKSEGGLARCFLVCVIRMTGKSRNDDSGNQGSTALQTEDDNHTQSDGSFNECTHALLRSPGFINGCQLDRKQGQFYRGVIANSNGMEVENGRKQG